MKVTVYNVPNTSPEHVGLVERWQQLLKDADENARAHGGRLFIKVELTAAEAKEAAAGKPIIKRTAVEFVRGQTEHQWMIVG
jgi:hypothetical protein